MVSPDLKIGYICFKNFTLLDLAGPYEILSWVFRCSYIIGDSRDPVCTLKGLRIVPDYDLSNAPAFDILVVPGGSGPDLSDGKGRLISFIRERHEKGLLTAAICTGTLLLAKAGILRGKEVTTHWLGRYELSKFGATYLNK